MTRIAHDQRFLAGIQNRLVIAFLTVTTIPLVALSIYDTHTHLRALEQIAFDAAEEAAGIRAREVQDALAGAQSDLFYLNQISSLDAYVTALHEPGGLDADYARDKLAKQFEAFVARGGTYESVVYMDGRGRELIRVTRTGVSTAAVPLAELASRPPREDLLRQADHLLAGQTLTQTDSAGAQPMLRFVTRLFPRGLQRRGFLILEKNLSALWEEQQLGESEARIVVLDGAGQVILGDANDLTPAVHEVIKAEPTGPVETRQGQIVTYVSIHPNRIDPSEKWAFVAIEPRAVVLRALTRYRRIFTVVLLLTLGAAGTISVLLARQFTIPLRRLYEAAQEIGRGRFDVALEDRTGDEIGGLARELRAMAEQLKIKHQDMQHQIDEKTRELLQAERLSTIGTMSAAIAHEVNNPLGIISLYSQMLSEQIPPDDPRAEKIRMISREASRMSTLVSGLLQFARRPELNLTPVNLALLIDEAISASMSRQERTDKIEVSSEVAADCPAIEADADQLGQVLRNLIVNALHALTDGGSVRIAAAPDGPNHVLIQVRDTGKGIEPENLPRLFEPFFTTRRFGAGTGLGLSISKEIIGRHGGTISVSSVVGQGTTFTIRLPRRADSSDLPPEESSTGTNQR